MRAGEFIAELGDSPAEHEPNRRRRRSLFHATVDGQWVDVFFDRSDLNGTLHITFAVNSSYDAPDRPTRASGSTVRILSTVLDIIQQRLPEYIRSARPPAVSFTAREDGRARLYRRYFVPVIQSILGPRWELTEYPNMGMTVFTWRPAKKKDVAEGVRAYHGNQGGIDTEQLHAPMWFTTSRRDAEQYAGDDGYVVVADLDIKNPYVIKTGQEEPNTVLHGWKELQAQGYDGIYDRRLGDWIPFTREQIHVISKDDTFVGENFADGRVKGRSRPGRVKRAGASCKGSVTDLRARAKKSSGEKQKMLHWCANMKSGRQKK